ncbi:MAG: DNA-methyltransferase [Terriglobales bacterium]
MVLGDCRETLRTLPDGIFNCCVTSPPYWGLRSYCADDSPEKAHELGLEATPDEYVAKMVEVFREVRRVLREDGTLWLNLGDSYARNGGAQGGGNRELLNMEGKQSRMTKIPDGSALKEKDLVGIPWLVAFALRADGWYLRSEIIWHKPNPMPESVTDRPTKAHEQIFLLSRSPRYYYDAEAIKEPVAPSQVGRVREDVIGGNKGDVTHHSPGGVYGRGGKNAFRGQGRERDGDNGPANREGRDMRNVGVSETRNKRSVWTVATRPYSGSHFATFPPDLIKPCILAGCPPGGVVLDPFMGSGTVGEVSEALGRRWFGCELNPEYGKLIAERTAQTGLAYPTPPRGSP